MPYEIGKESYRKTRQNLIVASRSTASVWRPQRPALVHPVFAMIAMVLSLGCARKTALWATPPGEGVNTDFAAVQGSDTSGKIQRRPISRHVVAGLLDGGRSSSVTVSSTTISTVSPVVGVDDGSHPSMVLRGTDGLFAAAAHDIPVTEIAFRCI